MENKIFNSGFNNVEIGFDRSSQQEIAINPAISDRYDENTSENIEDIYDRRNTMEQMEQLA